MCYYIAVFIYVFTIAAESTTYFNGHIVDLMYTTIMFLVSYVPGLLSNLLFVISQDAFLKIWLSNTAFWSSLVLRGILALYIMQIYRKWSGDGVSIIIGSVFGLILGLLLGAPTLFFLVPFTGFAP